MKIPVIYVHDGRSWAAETPALEGAFGQGRTRTEARRSLFEAIRLLNATYQDQGRETPFEKVSVRMEEMRT